MEKFTNPLDGIKIASPCPANWNEMRGDNRRRYCAECKLNVYNLSAMTEAEAENFIIRAEGRVCVKFYRRADGTILTKDCPVGWQAFKRRTSRLAKAFVSLCAGIFGGVFAFNQLQPNQNLESENSVKVSPLDSTVPLAKIEDFETVSTVPSIPSPDISHENFGYLEATVGQLIIEVEKPNGKQVKSKNKRRR